MQFHKVKTFIRPSASRRVGTDSLHLSYRLIVNIRTTLILISQKMKKIYMINRSSSGKRRNLASKWFQIKKVAQEA